MLYTVTTNDYKESIYKYRVEQWLGLRRKQNKKDPQKTIFKYDMHISLFSAVVVIIYIKWSTAGVNDGRYMLVFQHNAKNGQMHLCRPIYIIWNYIYLCKYCLLLYMYVCHLLPSLTSVVDVILCDKVFSDLHMILITKKYGYTKCFPHI